MIKPRSANQRRWELGDIGMEGASVRVDLPGQCGWAMSEQEVVEILFRGARRQRQVQYQHLEAGGGECRPVPDRPGFFRRQLFVAVVIVWSGSAGVVG